MTTETKVEAVARLDITAHGRGEWSAHESEEGMFILYAQHQSALDALRGEVERWKSRYDEAMQARADEQKRADAAERRVAELEATISAALAIAKESP